MKQQLLDRPSQRNGAKPDFAVYELVKGEPPVQPKKSGLVERVRPLLLEILDAGDEDWYRIAVYPGRGAGIAASRLRKTHPETDWEFRSVQMRDVDQSAIYVRCLKPGAARL